MNFKLSMVAALLVSFSAHAELQCERAKSNEGEDRIVNIRENGQKIESVNFGSDLSTRNLAADACRDSLVKSSCEVTQIGAQEWRISQRFRFKGDVVRKEAHSGYINTSTQDKYDDLAQCERSRVELAVDAIHDARSKVRRERAAENARRASDYRYQNEMTGLGSKL